MSRVLQFIVVLSIASLAGAWGLVVLGHKLFLRQITADQPAPEMTDEQLDRLLGDLHQLAERGYLPEATRERDAGELLNRYVALDSGAGEADERAWWSDREASDALKAIEGGWEERPEEAPEGDLSILTELLAYDHWESSSSGPYGRYVEEHGPVVLPTSPLPNQVPLMTLAKLRMAEGLRSGELEPALREVRHLARLVYSDETLVSTMVAVAILGIERSGAEAALARGLELPEGWSAVSEADVERMRAAGWTAAHVASGGAGPDAVAAMAELAEAGAAFGLCGGLHEAAGQYLFYVPFDGAAWPLEEPIRTPAASAEALLAASSCRLPQARQVIEDPSLITADLFDEHITGDGDEAAAMRLASRTPYLRRVVWGVLASVATPAYNRYSD